MVIAQGEVWWAELTSRLHPHASVDGMSAEGDLADPIGSAPGYRRPVVVVQSDAFNRSRIATVVCVVLTSNLKLADAPGNLLLRQGETGLDRDSVANVSQIVTLDKSQLTEAVGKLSRRKLHAVLAGIDVVLGR
jgi:mRNA interferase MazF